MNQHKTLLLPTCKGVESILLDNIVRIEALSNYSKLFFSNGKTLVVAKLLQWFENNLTAHLFARVHRSHIVNIAHIKHYCIVDNKGITLLDNSNVEVARRKKSVIKKLLCGGMADNVRILQRWGI